MKKILFFASDYKIGLSSLLVDELLALKQTSLDILSVAGHTEQELGLGDKLAKNNVDIIRIHDMDKHANFMDLAKFLKGIIIDNNIECVHVQNNWQIVLIGFVKYFLLRKYDLKIIYTIHAFRNNNPIKAIFGKIIIGTLLFLLADKIVCMSSYLVRNFCLLKYKIVQIPLGINADYFYEECPKMPKQGLQLIFPAQFREGKNQDLIIRAFARFIHTTNDEDSKLTLPGSGEYLEKMMLLAKGLGIENRVYFPGRVSKDEVKNMYLSSNIAIIASNSETFGQSIVEPFVLGRCIVTTHVGIADDIIKDKENGLFFKSEDDLVSIFQWLYSHSDFIGSAGRDNFTHKMQFHWSSISKMYVNMVKEI